MTSDDRALELLAAANPLPDPQSVPIGHPTRTSAGPVRGGTRSGVAFQGDRIGPRPRPGWVVASAFAATAIAVGGIAWLLRGGPESPATQPATTPITAPAATTLPAPSTAPVPVTAIPDAPLKIMAIGDFVTTGTATLNENTATYRCFLDQMLREAGIPFDFVGTQRAMAEGTTDYRCPGPFDMDHEAYASPAGSYQYTIADRALFMPGRVEDLQPDAALIHLGTEELLGSDPGKALAEPSGTPAEIAASLEAFIARLQDAKPDLTVFVAQIVPCSWTGRWACEEGVREFNDLVASMGNLSTGSSRVVVVDMNSGFDPDWIVNYGRKVSPLDEGDQEMAARWFAALQEAGLLDRSG